MGVARTRAPVRETLDCHDRRQWGAALRDDRPLSNNEARLGHRRAVDDPVDGAAGGAAAGAPPADRAFPLRAFPRDFHLLPAPRHNPADSGRVAVHGGGAEAAASATPADRPVGALRPADLDGMAD